MADGALARMVQDLRISANIPPPGENFRAMEDGLANIFIFEIRPGGNGRTLVYRYDVELKEVERDRSLTKASGDDGKRGLMRDICYQLVRTTFMNTNGFNSGGQAQFVYDNRKILYTNIRVNPMVCQLTPDRMNEYCRRFLQNATVTFELQPCAETLAHELDLNDLGRALQSAPHEQADHSLRTFLEMLTSQPFINAGTHTALGSGRLFEKKEHKRLTDAICAHKGISKGVRIIVNGDVKPCPAIVTDVKTCAFFVEGNLETIANAMISNTQRRRRLNPNNAKEMEAFWKDFGQLYKGVSAYLSYNPARVIVIDSITQRNCGDISFDIDGRSTSMVEFYRGKNENINPNMPAVRQHVERDSLYPLKCLHILPFQRVSLDKMSLNDEMAQISKELLTENATRPEVRFANIDAEMRKLGAEGDPAKFMRQFHIRLKGARNDVQLGMLALPNIKFGHTEQRQDDRGRFDVRGPMKYLEPSKCLNTWVVAHPRKIQQDRINRFIQQLTNMGRQRGMQIPDPVFELMEINQFEDKMQQFAQRKVNFVVYIDNKYTKSHAPLKLLERRFNILTQHVTFEMVEKAGPASISNVLGKMNMKLFGQNYVPIFNPACRDKFDLASGKVMVIGIDTSRPPRATAFEKHQLSKVNVIEGLESDEPMVVGICSNFLANPVKFVGDFYYQPCVQDVLNGDYLIEKMQWLFNQMKGNKRSPPQTIMVIRDGVSEGMVPNLLRTEFDAFVEGCNRFSRGWRPKFVYSIVDKRHNKRFFQKAENGNGRNGNGNGVVAANTMPGAVVDRKFVRVDMHELFLQAHFPLKGCAKIPQYIFPVNEIRANNNELEAFLHGLCNMWQIVNLAPALPTPVLQAKELAKRGRNNFVEFKRNNASIVPYLPAQQQNQRIRILDYQALNRMISYQEQALVRTRFNA